MSGLVAIARERLRLTLSAIRFTHSVFALPFALLAAFLAAGGVPPARTVFWIVLATVGARTAAMGFNRLVDREIDAKNPRTASRELPSGALSTFDMGALVVVGGAALVVSAGQLNRLCLVLSAPMFVVLLGYSLTKRFTSASHLVLGMALGLAPLGAWIAVTGRFALLPFVLGGAVMLWTAGFDVLYSLQDVEFDRGAGLHSIPVRFGVRGALFLSRLFHVATVALLVSTWALSGRGWILAAGVVLAAALLAWEQALVRGGDLSRLDAAFFTANGLVSVILFLAGALDLAFLGKSPPGAFPLG